VPVAPKPVAAPPVEPPPAEEPAPAAPPAKPTLKLRTAAPAAQ
jgi:hypothetical protein